LPRDAANARGTCHIARRAPSEGGCGADNSTVPTATIQLPRVVRFATVAAFLAIGVAAASEAAAGVHTTTAPTRSGPADSYGGLVRAENGQPCAGEYQVRGVTVHGRPACTHGPDGLPVFYAASGSTRGGGGKKSPAPSPSPTPTSTAPTAPTAPSGARCGTDGPRVQAVYVHAADVADRYASLLPSLDQWTANVDSVYATSAAETGGVRHVRFVTDANCVPVVADVTVSSTGDDNLSNTITELQAQGFNRTDRKYLLWVDAGVYCGIATVESDDSAAATNRNNSGPSYGRVDSGCWGGDTEAHELEHNLGGVQMSAPHSDGGWHCTDEYDRMCYETSGHTMTYPCALEHDHVFDCGHDDYFSTAPDPNGYLASHWNSANSVFLTSTS